MRRHDPRQDRNEAGATDLPWGNKGHAPHNAQLEKMTPSHRPQGAPQVQETRNQRKRAALVLLRKNAAIEEKKPFNFICIRRVRMKLR